MIVKIFLMGSRDLIAWRDTPNAVLVSLKLLWQLKMPFKCPYQNELLGGTKENNTILPIKRSLTLSFYITPNPYLLSRQINDFFGKKQAEKNGCWWQTCFLLSFRWGIRISRLTSPRGTSTGFSPSLIERTDIVIGAFLETLKR